MKEKLRGWGDRRPWLGRALDVQDKFSEINGAMSAAAITVTTFVSVFPLLLVAIAVIGFMAHGDQELPGRIIANLSLEGDAARTVERAITRASESRQAASLIGLVGMLWSGSAVAVALQYGVRAPWQEESSGIRDRLLGIAWLVGGGVLFAAALALGGVLNFLPDALPKPVVTVGAIVLGLVLEVAFFVFLYWGLGTRRVPWRSLVPGAVLAAVGFELLKLVGTVYVPRLVARSSSLYGPLGIVFAILAWLTLFAKLIVYGSTLNAVRYEAEHGTREVTIHVPRLPDDHAVAATRGGTILLHGDDGPAVPGEGAVTVVEVDGAAEPEGG